MSALDAYAQPLDAGPRFEQDTYLQQQADLAAKQRQQQQESDDKDAKAAEMAREAQVKSQMPIAGVDMMQWGDVGEYRGKAWHELPREAQEHFRRDYVPGVAAQAPKMWNETVQQSTGKIPGVDDMTETERTVGEDGKTTRHFKPNGQSGVQFDAFTTPQDVMDRLPSNELGIAQQLAHHDIALSNLSRLPGDTKMRIMNAAKVLNPGWESVDYPAIQASRKDFTSGKAANSITSLNTVMNHLGGVLDAIPWLSNVGSPMLNAPLNYLGKNLRGNSAITSYETHADLVSEEMAKLLKGGVATKSEIESWREKLDRNLGPDQLKKNIEAMKEAIGGRVGALRNQWKYAYPDVPGAPSNPKPFLSQASQDTLRKHGFDPSTIDETVAPQAAKQQQPPAAAVLYLKSNPSAAAHFDEKYGAGSAKKILNP